MTVKSARQHRSIGTLVEVSADRFTIELAETSGGYSVVGFDDQHYVGRIGTLILLPISSQYVVAEVVGLQEKPTSNSSQRNYKSVDEVDQSTVRLLRAVPFGMLPYDPHGDFVFGCSEYPPLFADVLHAEINDLNRLFLNHTSSEEGKRYVELGRSTIFPEFPIKADINEFFGAHAAVLGSTGSGKSCTISSILQATLNEDAIGASIIVFDINGEYSSALSELPSPIKSTVFRVNTEGTNAKPEGQIEHTSFQMNDSALYGDSSSFSNDSQALESFVGSPSALLRMPHWLFTVDEWSEILLIRGTNQQSILRNALRLIPFLKSSDQSDANDLRDNFLSYCLKEILFCSESHTSARSRMMTYISRLNGHSLDIEEFSKLLCVYYGLFQTNKSEDNLPKILKKLNEMSPCVAPLSELAHDYFSIQTLVEAIDWAVLWDEANGNTGAWDSGSALKTRLEQVSTLEFSALFQNDLATDKDAPTLVEFVDKILGWCSGSPSDSKSHHVAILDLSGVPDYIAGVIVGVVTRLVFERQRVLQSRNSRPISLILEEAHRYIPKQSSLEHPNMTQAIIERVAKEGRKYGLTLLVASQRPSDLSQAVLSQCTNFIVHRLQNPADLTHVRQMTPLMSDSILDRLATLPTQHALVFGTAVSLPSTLKIRTAYPRPRSDSSDIGTAWYPASVNNPNS